MSYQPRYCIGTIEGYDGDEISLQVNPTGDEVNLLRNGGYSQEVLDLLPLFEAAKTDEAKADVQGQFDAALERGRSAYGAVVARTFGHKVYTVGGFILDFSVADKALATITDESLPTDLHAWLRAAPLAAVEFEQERIRTSLKKSLRTGT